MISKKGKEIINKALVKCLNGKDRVVCFYVNDRNLIKDILDIGYKQLVNSDLIERVKEKYFGDTYEISRLELDNKSRVLIMDKNNIISHIMCDMAIIDTNLSIKTVDRFIHPIITDCKVDKNGKVIRAEPIFCEF